MACVTCHMSHVKCHLSPDIYHQHGQPQPQTLPLLTPHFAQYAGSLRQNGKTYFAERQLANLGKFFTPQTCYFHQGSEIRFSFLHKLLLYFVIEKCLNFWRNGEIYILNSFILGHNIYLWNFVWRSNINIWRWSMPHLTCFNTQKIPH